MVLVTEIRPTSTTTQLQFSFDINDAKMPTVSEFDSFNDWANGHCCLIYEAANQKARKHVSGWAMRNTNNHNVNILKKSCLGVLRCSARCQLPNGASVNMRPAICDKARRKQQGKQCPNRNCLGRLEIQSCRGHCGYPVTHFWRKEGQGIYFQAKGTHDHPPPEPKGSTDMRRLLKGNSTRNVSLNNKLKKHSKLKNTKILSVSQQVNYQAANHIDQTGFVVATKPWSEPEAYYNSETYTQNMYGLNSAGYYEDTPMTHPPETQPGYHQSLPYQTFDDTSSLTSSSGYNSEDYGYFHNYMPFDLDKTTNQSTSSEIFNAFEATINAADSHIDQLYQEHSTNYENYQQQSFISPTYPYQTPQSADYFYCNTGLDNEWNIEMDASSHLYC